jgi:two-component sensor histidine kinase
MITAFLWFESKKKGNENHFSELINRIKSMSLIHEYLCNSKDLSHINTQEYLEEMLQAIVQTYHNSKVSIQTNVEKIRLEFDTIMSLGIILNEIISNSIKHHPKTQPIILKLSCFKKNRRIIVQIQDNGKGFDCNEQNMGFGLRLIKDFTKKLPNASYAFYQKEGTLFELIFDSKENNES